MQVDAMSDELLEELDARPTPNVPIAAPPPLPRRRRWTGRAVAALVGVVIAAALLAVGAAALLFGGDDNAHATGTEAPAGPDPVPEVAPLQLDEFVIESGETDEPAEERTPE
jgi:hypothetical protein